MLGQGSANALSQEFYRSDPVEISALHLPADANCDQANLSQFAQEVDAIDRECR
jgi:hypothetical protein